MRSSVQVKTLSNIDESQFTIQKRSSLTALSQSFANANPKEDGLLMMSVVSKRKQSDQQVFVMENRVKRLEFEEERAKRKMEDTNKKLSDILAVRDKLQKEKEEKMLWKMKLKDQEDSLRAKNSYERTKMKTNINKTLSNLKNRNKGLADDENQTSQSLLEQHQADMLCDFELRQKLKEDVQRDKREMMERNIRHIKTRSVDTRNRFTGKISENKNKQQSNSEKMKELERTENDILERLKMTVQRQQEISRNLEKILKEKSHSPNLTSSYNSSPLHIAKNGSRESLNEDKSFLDQSPVKITKPKLDSFSDKLIGFTISSANSSPQKNSTSVNASKKSITQVYGGKKKFADRINETVEDKEGDKNGKEEEESQY